MKIHKLSIVMNVRRKNSFIHPIFSLVHWRTILPACLLIVGMVPLYPQTVPDLTMLGFSADNAYMAFAEHGIGRNNILFSTIYVVDVEKNVFVPQGIEKRNYFNQLTVGQSARTALVRNTLYESELLKSYLIDPLNLGRLIYVSLGKDTDTDVITFDDHETNRRYSLTLHTHVLGSSHNNTLRSATQLSLDVYHQRTHVATLTIGDPRFYRNAIEKYTIHSIYVSKDNTSIAIFLEKIRRVKDEISLEYMVETARIP